jgi:predicted ATPase/DNA-binding CsgD family transcriptional regulator
VVDQQAEFGRPDPALAGVTDREVEVLELLGDQATHEEIASRLFISVRTVESHARSLRQKLDLDSRRALLKYAVGFRALMVAERPRLRPARLPEPLTSFVGRHAERRALAAALLDGRLVTAIGPAGVGKTRLALAVVRDAAPRYADGACHVDLATTTDAARIPQAMATALGVRGVTGQPMLDTLLSVLSDRDVLLLMDNAEHLVDPVAAAIERLLDGCPGVDVLATSRVRLAVPFERVYDVPGLSLPAGPEGPDAEGDAVALFTGRATAFGLAAPDEHGRARISRICRALDGMALAIELAAARAPALGLDGVEQGIGDQLALLTGGSWAQPRHRSLENALAWSYRLLSPADQQVLRRVATFVSPFTSAAASVVAGYGDVTRSDVAGSLGRLVESSLLTTVGTTAGGVTRYRAWESIRQYARTQWVADLDHEAQIQHLRWCRAGVAELLRAAHAAGGDDGTAGRWYDAVDALADEARAALDRVTEDGRHTEGAGLASELGNLLFRRGRIGEAQRRHEQAAELAPTPGDAHDHYVRAAQSAACALTGEDMLRLWECAAAAADGAGLPAARAVATARAAEVTQRWGGMFAERPAPAAVSEALAVARAAAVQEPRARAALMIAELFVDEEQATIPVRAAEVIRLARQLEDPLLETAARDAWTMHDLNRGGMREAAAHSRRRVELLTDVELTPAAAMELKDALHVAVFTALGVGDLGAARGAADQQRSLPFLREDGSVDDEEVLAPAALSGDWQTVVRRGEKYRNEWERAGRRCAPGRALSPSATLMVHRIREDAEATAVWLDVVSAVRGVPAASAMRGTVYGEVFEGIALLHRGAAAAALEELQGTPDSSPLNTVFGSWRSALLAEAAVLAGKPDATDRIAAAEAQAVGNPVAAALTCRASALHHDDGDALAEAADALDAAGCRYQWARTMVLMGGGAAETGRDALAAIGAAPMSE